MRSIRPAALLALSLALAACNSTASDELAQRVQVLEDKDAIKEVIIEYGEYLDARDYKSYASLFAEKGVWTGGFGTFTGPAAIEEMLEKNMGTHEEGWINKDNFHLDTTIVVDVDGDKATARSRYLFMTRTPENSPHPLLAGRYVDELVRENGEWKILKRTSHGVIPYRDGNAPPPPRPAALDKVVSDGK